MRAIAALVLVVSAACSPAAAPSAEPSDDPDTTDSGAPPVVATTHGPVRGVAEDGLRIFRGIPYAAPPVGELRWRPPVPPEPWVEVRPAEAFGPRCMQARLFDDMVFRDGEPSEDCLYLNVWAPATPKRGARAERLPVLVYFYGGGFLAGSGSEPRYDGAAIARDGVVVVTLNYRLGVFGFLAHPELSAEAEARGGPRSSGNQGLLDQAAALRWVRDNIAAFGGDPERVTIGGESAGSISVSAQMASPVARGLFHRAIGESGSILGDRAPVPLAEAEAAGVAFAGSMGAASLAELRALSGAELLEATGGWGGPRFPITVDGRFFPRPPAQVYAAGEQARVPLLLGWNSEEMGWPFLLGDREPTPEAYREVVRELYPRAADQLLALYPGGTRDEVIASATDLAGDRFIALGTWRWFELHRRTGGAPVYRYLFTRPRPPAKAAPNRPEAAGAPPATGAVHSAEIEYALGNLDTHPAYAWTEDDHAVSATFRAFVVSFVKTGDPNGPGLPAWPAAAAEPEGDSAVMVIDVESRAVPAPHRKRYELLDRLGRPDGPGGE